MSGRRLARPHRFSFTTPTVKLLEDQLVSPRRTRGRADGRLLRFNQPVRPADVAPHVRAEFEPHDWHEPALPREGLARLKPTDPTSVQRFNAKVDGDPRRRERDRRR